jgi:hypothetical protein
MAKTSAPWVALLCDKCGQPVSENNSVAKVELHAFGNGGAAIARGDRHLNPVIGEHPCEGSPSRVQKFRDIRSGGRDTGFINTSLMGHCIDPEPDIQ